MDKCRHNEAEVTRYDRLRIRGNNFDIVNFELFFACPDCGQTWTTQDTEHQGRNGYIPVDSPDAVNKQSPSRQGT